MVGGGDGKGFSFLFFFSFFKNVGFQDVIHCSIRDVVKMDKVILFLPNLRCQRLQASAHYICIFPPIKQQVCIHARS